MDHEGKETHLGGTSLVQFLGAKVVHLLLAGATEEADGEGRSGEVTWEGSFGLLPSGNLKGTAECEDLECAWNWNGEGRVPSGSEVGELGSIGGDITWEVDASLVDKVSNNTELADTSVLNLNTTETIELGLVTISYHAKRIEETKGGLGTKFILKCLESSGGDDLVGGGGKSRSGGNEGGENGELHLESV